MIDTGILSSGIITEEQLDEERKKYPLKRFGKPEEIAYAIIYLLSDASSFVTGSNLFIRRRIYIIITHEDNNR